MPPSDPDQPRSRVVRLFRNGRNQALRIPKELELAASEATIRRDGERLIVEPIPRQPRLTEVLAALRPLDEGLPDVDDQLLPAEDVEL